MKPHLIVGRFGPSDRATVPAGTDEVVTTLDLVRRLRVRLDHGIGQVLKQLGALPLFPTEVGLDLLIMAAHVHAADRASLVPASRRTAGPVRSG